MWNGVPLLGMSSVAPAYQGLHLKGLLMLWQIILYTNLSNSFAH